IGVEPTNETAAMSGCSRIASTATLSPMTTLKTPSGSPASFSSSAVQSDADGLADLVDFDPGRRLLRVLALQERRDAAAVLDDLEPARHLPRRVREHLAVLGSEDPRHLVTPVVQELPDPEEE